LLTGPWAFLLGGVIDLLAFAAASWRARWSARHEDRERPGAC
jgi:hypothetical protein